MSTRRMRPSVPALIQNNIFRGPGPPVTQPGAIVLTNLVGMNPQFSDPADFVYALNAGSPAIDAGSMPGVANGFSLAPAFQYIHSACQSVRANMNQIDIGAYEAGSAQGTQCASYAAQPPVTPTLPISSSPTFPATPPPPTE